MQESRDVYELVTILRPLPFKPSKIMIQRQERNLQSPWCFVDVPVAKAGHPTIAMARCFVGPMFNMLLGLVTTLVTQTTNVS